MQNRNDKKEQQVSLTKEELQEVLKRIAISHSDLSEQERCAVRLAVQCIDDIKAMRKVMSAAEADLNYMCNGFASQANKFIPDDRLWWRYRCDICKYGQYGAVNKQAPVHCDPLYNKYEGEHCFEWRCSEEADELLERSK